jgi:hypothetical protein
MKAKLNPVRANPVDSYTKLLLHLDNNVNDVTGKTVTNNNVTFSTPGKFGYEAVFNGTNAWLSVPDSDDFNFGSGDFTIDGWFRTTLVGGNNSQMICTQGNQGEDTYWVLSYNYYGVGNNSGNHFAFSSYNGAQIEFDQDPISANTWYHFAMVRNGNTWNFYLNGVASTPVLLAGAYTDPVPNINGVLSLGSRYWHGSNIMYLNGGLDEVRLSKGIARWTSNFTPPSNPYGSDLQGKINFPGFQEIADFISDGTETSFNVAVDGDTDKEYKIVVRNLTSNSLVLSLNKDTSSIYGRQLLQNNNGTISCGRYVGTWFYVGYASAIDEMTLLTPVGFPKTLISKTGTWTSGTTVYNFSSNGFVYTGTGNITSLNFFIDNSSAFTSGTRITVYARRSN